MTYEYKFRATNIETGEQWEFGSSSSDATGSAKRKASRRWPVNSIDLAIFDDHDTKKYKTRYEKRNGKWNGTWRPHEIYNCRATNLHTGEQFVGIATSIRGAKAIASRQYPNNDIHIVWFNEYIAIYEPEKDWTSYRKSNGKWELSADAELVGMLARQDNVKSREAFAHNDKLEISYDDVPGDLTDFEARKTINLNDVIVLDTETTGLGREAEICEIAMINGNGKVLLNTLVKPTKRIPKAAIKIHGITNRKVISAPAWSKIHAKFINLIEGKTLYIYNAKFDLSLIRQTVQAQDEDLSLQFLHAECVMKDYAKYKGIGRRYNGYKWHKLEDAARHCNVPVEKTHRALADCIITLGIMQHIYLNIQWRVDKKILPPVQSAVEIFGKSVFSAIWKALKKFL